MQNPILQVSYSYKNQTSYPPSIPLSDIDDELTVPVRTTSFRITKTKEQKQILFLIDDFGKNSQILSLHQPVIFQPDNDHKYRFQLTNDFITSDTKRFSTFIKVSLILHLTVAVIFYLVEFFTPAPLVKTPVTVDFERIKQLMEKVKQNKKIETLPAKEIVKVAPPPAQTPVPEKKIVQDKPKKPALKTNVSTEKKIATPSPKPPTGPAKKLVAVKGPPKTGGQRITKEYTPGGGGGRKVQSSQARASGAGAAKATYDAKVKSALSSSLGFLSDGPSKFSVDAPSIGSPSTRYATGGSGGKAGAGNNSKQKNYLNKLVANSGSGGTGPIETTGARSIASGKVISDGDIRGSEDGKSLNSVQGKVVLSRLYDYQADGQVGGAIGNDRSMKVSGKGKISVSDVERTLADKLHKLQYCYEKALLFNTSLVGNLWAKWMIDENGRVSTARITKSELNEQKLHNCFISELKMISFPRPKGGAVEIEYPFNFKSSSL